VNGAAESEASVSTLTAGMLMLVGGGRVVTVSGELARTFQPGDRLISAGDALLHVTSADTAAVALPVDQAIDAFRLLAEIDDHAITSFYRSFADLIDDDTAFGPVLAANASDVDNAKARGRSVTRLELGPTMRVDMASGLRSWADSPVRRDFLVETVQHEGWRVELRRAPLGVVGFVFEGRPNVFADAAGVLRSGNTVVFRIGSDALGTARAMMEHAVQPALRAAGLPLGCIGLVDSPTRSSGWALFSDQRLSLAVARGSGLAVEQLGAVARQHGIPASLHGTGGAWTVVSEHAQPATVASQIRWSLDRKVCNTLNVCCVIATRAEEFMPVVLAAIDEAATAKGVNAKLHAHRSALPYIPSDRMNSTVEIHRADGIHVEAAVAVTDDLAHEWEWEQSPELTLAVVQSVDEAVALFNAHSPRLVATLISENAEEQQRFYDTIDAPFVGNGFTRWVDGQFALNKPELGLSNWEGGRLFARSGVLSGDSVHTIRAQMILDRFDLHR
jgi:glutamate-5-semialdehyde dehydrogenase